VVTVTNTGTIATTSPGDDPGDDTSPTTTTIRWPDLRIVKDDGLTQVQPGDVVIYTLTVTNTGLAPAAHVTLTETIPTGSRIRSNGWTPQPNGTATLAIGTLAPGASATRLIALELPNPIATSSITNTVQVANDIPDPTPGNNTSTDVDQVISGQLGDRVWNDANTNGVQDPNEPGLAGATLQLLDATTRSVLATRTTDLHGAYLFDGLRLGHYVVQIDPQTTLSGPYAGYRLTTPALFDRTLTNSARSDLTADVGLYHTPTTDVTLASFRATLADTGLVLNWTTTHETTTDHFKLVRSATPDQATATEIASRSSQGTNGGSYTITDSTIPASGAYYWLIEVARDGHQQLLVGWSQPGSATPPPAPTYTVVLPEVVK
jgi:uncharacterized repeat protein (TIGR01451 family)